MSHETAFNKQLEEGMVETAPGLSGNKDQNKSGWTDAQETAPKRFPVQQSLGDGERIQRQLKGAKMGFQW